MENGLKKQRLNMKNEEWIKEVQNEYKEGINKEWREEAKNEELSEE